jgi:aryl-alcohol dehydrogenase-like predicted oxidoreductase
MHRAVEKSADLSLESLGKGIDYIDLLLVHCIPLVRTVDSRAYCV